MAAKKNTTRRQPSAAARQRQAELERQAQKERSARAWRTAGIVILSVLLLGILAAAGLGIAYLVTDGFGGKVPTAVVMIGDEMYTEDAEGLALYPGDEVRVQSLTGAAEYEYRIEANDGGDFAFTVGEEPYTWADLAGTDMTKGFTIQKTANGFTVDYESLQAIVSAALGSGTSIPDEADTSGDLFRLVITMGEKELHFGFAVGVPVEDVELDPDHVTMAGAEDPAELPDEEVPDEEQPDEEVPEEEQQPAGPAEGTEEI